MFCLQNGTSFGKSQLLNGVTLENQNKNKMAGNFKNLKINFSKKEDFFPVNRLLPSVWSSK